MQEQILAEIRDWALKQIKKNPSSHDWDHTLRVLQNAQKLWEMEQQTGNLFIITAAIYLHDIARSEDVTRTATKPCHAQRGAELAEPFLATLPITIQDRQSIVRAIATHRYRQKNPLLKPETIEEKIVFDADKLDGLGAVGIGRAFHFAGRLGARLHNSKAEALSSEEFSLEDTAWREFLVKLQHVPEKMLTNSGKQCAQERMELMTLFFQHLNQECGFEND